LQDILEVYKIYKKKICHYALLISFKVINSFYCILEVYKVF